MKKNEISSSSKSTNGKVNNIDNSEKIAKISKLIELTKQDKPENIEKAIFNARKSLQLAQDISNHKLAFKSAHILCDCLVLNNEFSKADEIFQKMIFHYNKIESDKTYKCYSWYANFYFNIQNYELSLKYFEEAIKIAEDQKDKEFIANIMVNISVIYIRTDNHHKAKSILIQILKNMENLGDKSGICRTNVSLGNLYYKFGDLPKALDFYFQAYKINAELKNIKGIGISANNIANIYIDLSQYEKALEYYNISLKMKKQLNDNTGIATTLNNIGIVFRETGNFTEANSNFKKALKIYKKSHCKKDIAMVLQNIGNTYSKNDDHKNALDFLSKSVAIKREFSNTFSLSITLNNAAASLIEIRDFHKAEKFLKESLKYSLKNDSKQHILAIYQLFSKLYKNWKTYDKYIEFNEKYLDLKEKTDKEIFSKKMAEMQTKYETQRKEKETIILQKKNSELEKKNQQINQQKTQLEKTLEQLRKSEISYEYINNQLKGKLGTKIIGESEQIRNINILISKVANSSTTVLITGETGTGKELVARAIHDLSYRKKNNFCAVNISSISDSLFESEFFGYKKNAFTGARTDKTGWFEIANEGTLFLDELGTLNIDLQSKLLRTLEEKKIVPVGSNKEIPVDFRLISASNENLIDLIEKKRFRLDLYHRLSTFVINIPPLRERVEDIPLLTEYFVRQFSSIQNKKINRIEKQVIIALQSYSFPGNVRELKNIVERAIIMTNSSTLKLKCFNIPNTLNKNDDIVPLLDLEKSMVLKALKSTGFHQKNAAKLIHITPKSLERRMIKHKIKKNYKF